jgi:type I restriction enzyme, S subunit
MKTKTLGEICKPKQWKSLASKDFLEFGYPVYGANGVIGFYSDYNHEHQTIAIGCRGACGFIHITKPQSYITSNAMALDDLDVNECNPLYLAKYLTYRGLADVTTGAAQPQITRTNLERVEIPLPPISDQIRIANLLSKVDALIIQRKQHLQQLEYLLKSVFLEMFGDPTRNEMGWDKYPLSHSCQKITDGTHDTPERLGTGVPFITGKHIRPYSIDYKGCDFVSLDDHSAIYSRCDPKYGDVLYTNIGVNLGTAAMNTVCYEFSMKNVALLRPSPEINSRFLEHFLNFEKVKAKIISDLSSGGAQKFLGLGQIKKVVIISPQKALQDKFAQIVEKVERLKFQHLQNLSHLDALYRALSQKAFKGELDLSRVVLVNEQSEQVNA